MYACSNMVTIVIDVTGNKFSVGVHRCRGRGSNINIKDVQYHVHSISTAMHEVVIKLLHLQIITCSLSKTTTMSLRVIQSP